MYLIIDDPTQEAAVVDPYDAPKISNGAKDNHVNVRLIGTAYPLPLTSSNRCKRC